jgi:hypothetical protein
MYTDGGMFSRAEICRRVTSYWNWSFHFGGGSAGYQAGLFAIAGLLGVALVAGFQTRWVVIGSWLMLISVQHRVPPVLSGADILLRMLLFWGMFLPLGRTWGVDAWMERKAGRLKVQSQPVLSIASAAILLQMGMMYLFSALFKTNTEWLTGGVIESSLAHDFYSKPLGTWLLQYPGLLKVMTYGVFALEWIGPLLLFIPLVGGKIRIGAVFALAAMHIGIALTLQVDLFSPVTIAGLILFLPPSFWDRMCGTRPIETAQKAERMILGRRSSIGLAAEGVCALALAYVVMVNVRSLPAFSAKGSAPSPSFLRTACGLGQKWNMFDEAPSKDGWYVAVATLNDGRQVDLLRDGLPVDWRRPSNPPSVYPNHRWRKLFREMAFEDAFGYQFFRQPVASFLVREWNRRHSETEQIARFELVYNMEQSVPENPASRSMIRERIAEVDLRDS